MRYQVLMLSVVGLLCAQVAAAQGDPKVGLTMGYPGAVGVLWQATERVALRPEFTVSSASIESTSFDTLTGTRMGPSPNESWQTGVGLSALFYLTRHEGLRTYVSPRYVYSRSNSSNTISGSAFATDSDTWSHSTSGSFGAQYTLGRRFGVFGEAGLSYASTTSRLTTVEAITTGVGAGVVTRTFTLRSDSHSNALSTRGGAGVVFFF